MILAAGRGQRMGALTDNTPKPLLLVKGKPLMQYHLEALARAGIKDVVINLGHKGSNIENAFGRGSQFDLSIQYSYEDPILETGGGIAKALPLLGDKPFIVVSGDVLTDFPFEGLPTDLSGLAHLVLVDNPSHHANGDYALMDGVIATLGGPLFNFAGIGVYHPHLFIGCPEGAFRLPQLFKKPMAIGQITGEHYPGLWHNVGTPEQLAMLNLEE